MNLTINLYNRQQAKQALTAQVFPFLGEALQSGLDILPRPACARDHVCTDSGPVL